jgi:hypothetical protein
MRVTLCAIVLLVGSVGAVRPFAQSLGDIARKEEERRKEVKTPAKVYTNKDLGAPIQGGSPDTAPPAASGTPSDASSAAAAPPDDKAKDAGPTKDQAYWSKRKKDLQDALGRGQTQADAMQSRINALTADFAGRDDPIQRAIIERDRQRALSELAHLQQDIKDTQKALTDLDEEARKAGVPPGWLR